MILRNFLSKFNETEQHSVEEDKSFYKDLPSELYELLKLEGGATFDNGLYRVHTFTSSLKWSLLIAEFFNDYSNKIYPFGFDWMGRQFCLRSSGDMLLMFDPATGEAFELEQTISLLHNEDFANDKDGMLSSVLFTNLLHKNGLANIKYNECLGYKVPLFLGGKDEPNNYEVQDLEVYWHIQNQLYKKVKDLPEGTKIGNINLQK